MTTYWRRPVAALAVALGVLLTTMIMDRGSPGNRGAALLTGSVALYVLISAALLWLVAAAVRQRRSGGRR